METDLIIIIIAQVLGIISWLLLLYSYTKEDIDKLLFIQILVSVFDIASYLLLGADAGLLICAVELIRTILYYKTNKDNLIFIISMILYAVIALVTIKTWYAFLPILGSIIDAYGTSRDSKVANYCSIVSNTLWTIYDILILSYIGALNDIVVVICNICVLALGYSRLMHISKFRIVKYNYLTRKTVDQIYKMDFDNFGEENTWNREYQLEVYKRNKDSLYAIKYKNDFVGYINYLNVPEDEYQRLTRVRKMPNSFNLESIIPFKQGRKSYVIIETINVKKEYDKEQTVELITKKLIRFINAKYRQRIYVHGILGFALNDLEENIYKSMGFTKLKDLEDNIKLYELNEDDIKSYIK